MNNAIKNLRTLIAVALICATYLVNVPRIDAAGSHLDHSFSSNGKLTTNFGTVLNPTEDIGADVEVMSNGKVVVAGESDGNFAVARYNADGSLDTSFGGDGKVTTNLTSADRGDAVAIQTDGKIIVAGYAAGSGTGADFAVLRYKTDGTLDTTFSGDGSVLIDFHGFNDYPFGLAIQPDGKIVVVGMIWTTEHPSNRNWGLARLNANGSLDTSFDGNGKRSTDFQGEDDGARDVLVQSDGRIVVAGYGGDDQYGRRFAIARYNSNGAFDTTFGTGGKTMIAFTGSISRDGTADGVARTSNGKYVLAGASGQSSGQEEVTLMRLTSSGTLDATFDGDGFAMSDQQPDANENASDVALQPDGKIVVSYASYGPYIFGLLRYLSDGSLDPTFGTGGRVNNIFGTSGEMVARALDYQPAFGGEGKIVAAGYYLSGADYDFAVCRYTLTGIAATSDFSGDGIADHSVFRPSDGTWRWTDLISQHPTISWGQAGDIAVPGDYDGNGQTDAAVFRINTWRIAPYTPESHPVIKQFGLAGDKPVQGDYDGDGKTDIAVYRPSDGVWHVERSSLGYISYAFGTSEDKPAPGDYDGDGLHDLATFRPSEGIWYLQRSTFGFTSFQFGLSEDIPVPGDYDGDTKTDAAVFRPSTATWYGIFSQTGEAFTIQFGISSDIPSPADFDGDGRTDVTVFRPSTGTWYVQPWNGSVTAITYGANGDVPVPSAYKPQ